MHILQITRAHTEEVTLTSSLLIQDTLLMFFQNRPSERLSSLVTKGENFQRVFDKAKKGQKGDTKNIQFSRLLLTKLSTGRIVY